MGRETLKREMGNSGREELQCVKNRIHTVFDVNEMNCGEFVE